MKRDQPFDLATKPIKRFAGSDSGQVHRLPERPDRLQVSIFDPGSLFDQKCSGRETPLGVCHAIQPESQIVVGIDGNRVGVEHAGIDFPKILDYSGQPIKTYGDPQLPMVPEPGLVTEAYEPGAACRLNWECSRSRGSKG
jgi:hypothetical protein